MDITDLISALGGDKSLDQVMETVDLVLKNKTSLLKAIDFIQEHGDELLDLMARLPDILGRAGAALAEDLTRNAARAIEECHDHLASVGRLVARIAQEVGDLAIPSFAVEQREIMGLSVVSGIDIKSRPLAAGPAADLASSAQTLAEVAAALSKVSSGLGTLGGGLAATGARLGQVGGDMHRSGVTLAELGGATVARRPTPTTRPAPRRPTATKPPTNKPAAKKPAAKKPATKKPAAKKPAAKKPATTKPAARPAPGSGGLGGGVLRRRPLS